MQQAKKKRVLFVIFAIFLVLILSSVFIKEANKQKKVVCVLYNLENKNNFKLFIMFRKIFIFNIHGK